MISTRPAGIEPCMSPGRMAICPSNEQRENLPFPGSFVPPGVEGWGRHPGNRRVVAGPEGGRRPPAGPALSSVRRETPHRPFKDGRQRRRAAGCRAGLAQELSAGLMVVPGGTISSMWSSTASSRTTSAAASWLSSCSMVRGPMIAAVMAGWLRTNAIASWMGVIPPVRRAGRAPRRRRACAGWWAATGQSAPAAGWPARRTAGRCPCASGPTASRRSAGCRT